MSILNPSYKRCGLEAIDANGPRLLLAEHHRCLEIAGRELLAFLRAGDSRGLISAFRAFEAEVRAHMKDEEDLVLPAYRRAFPIEAGAITKAHAQLRVLLARASIDAELHSLSNTTLTSLLEALEEHGRFEDRTMYPWARVHVEDPSRRSLVERIEASLSELARIALHR